MDYTDNSGLLYLLVSIIGLQIVVYAIMQNELNLYFRDSNFKYY